MLQDHDPNPPEAAVQTEIDIPAMMQAEINRLRRRIPILENEVTELSGRANAYESQERSRLALGEACPCLAEASRRLRESAGR
jgi:hypothetical protein